MTGTLFIVSAPSGAGKTSLVKALVERLDHIRLSVSYTTRPPRPGEREGVDYHFVDEDTFRRMVREGAFLEHARVFDHFYGTSRAWIEEQLRAGTDVVLEIDWQGARQVREVIPGAVGIFILPPSRAVLEARLRGRGQDDEAVIARRMQDAVNEMRHYKEYDYLVINDVFDEALEQLTHIVLAARLRTPLQGRRHADLIRALLAET